MLKQEKTTLLTFFVSESEEHDWFVIQNNAQTHITPSVKTSLPNAEFLR